MISKKWKPPYQKKQDNYYAYHDIDEHKNQILSQIKYWHVENMKYVIPNINIKPGEVNFPFCDKIKIIIANREFVVNNTENYVNEFGIAMNPIDCQEFKYDIMEVN